MCYRPCITKKLLRSHQILPRMGIGGWESDYSHLELRLITDSLATDYDA